METSKLMTPLFYNGNFNREDRRMRAVLEREVSDGTQTYRLWHSAGKPTVDYPRTENDRYILYVEANGYLVSIGLTDYKLTDICGFEPAAQKLYGGREKRGAWIDALKASGGNDAVSAAVAEEQKEIEQYGGDPARQEEYILNFLNDHVSIYLKARENGGQTFPDFIGALVMNDLARCMELSEVYRKRRQDEHVARRALAEEEERAYCVEQNQIAEQAVAAAVQTILNGGVLKNEKVRFCQSKYSSSTYSIINYLMRLYQVDVPLRTQGWINEKLVNATIQDGKCKRLQYFRSKGGRCSQKFFQCMNALIQAVTAQASEEAA